MPAMCRSPRISTARAVGASNLYPVTNNFWSPTLPGNRRRCPRKIISLKSARPWNRCGTCCIGVNVDSVPDGINVTGTAHLKGAEIQSCGDHRIAMAFAVAALAADGPCTILNSDAAGVSFPEFFDTLHQIAQ